MRRTVLRALLVGVVLTACSLPGDGPAGPVTTIPPGGAAHSCPLEQVDGCRVFGVVLSEPVDLATALAEVSILDGTPLGVWRPDAVCVPSTLVTPDPQPVASNFAYVDAQLIRERRLEAVNSGAAPPITGLMISEAYWTHWEAQWALMGEPGVEIVAIAAYLSDRAAEQIGSEPLVEIVLELESRRTDSLDPEYAGELLLVDEEFPPGFIAVTPAAGC